MAVVKVIRPVRSCASWQERRQAFEIPKAFDFEEFMRPSFGVFQGEGVKVKIRFAPDAAGYIKEKIWHDNQKIVPQKDGSIVFEAEVAGTEEIKFWILSWGSKAQVIEPESLREEIRAESEVMAEKYAKPCELKSMVEPLLELFLLPAEIIMPCHALYAKAQLSNQRD